MRRLIHLVLQPVTNTLAACAVVASPLLVLPLAAQDRTLLGDCPVSISGSGGPVFGVSRLSGHSVLISGGHGGVTINRRLLIGGGVYRLSRGVHAASPIGSGDPRDHSLRYGGLEVGYVTQPGALVHATFGALLGRGTVKYTDATEAAPSLAADQPFGETIESKLFVAEPRVGLQLNVSRWVRVQAAAGYRFVSGSHLASLADADLRGATGVLSLRFGAF